MNRRHVLTALAGATASALTPAARAQAAGYPSKPIRFIVPFTPGSGADSGSRAYGEMLSRLLGQSVVVENRPGASGMIAIQAVRSAPADGYTAFVGTNTPMCVLPVLNRNLPYDPFRDFRPVHGFGTGVVAFVVKGDSPHRTLGDVIAAVKRERRPLNIGSYSDGYMLVGAWLGLAAGIEVSHVAYKGGAQLQNDVMGGSLEFGLNDLGGVITHIKDGRLRGLAVSGASRDRMVPQVPTMLELGFAEFETYTFSSLYVRRETPDDITHKLADAVRTVMLSPEGKAYQATQPSAPMMMHTRELGEFQRREFERFKKVAEAAGIQPK
jgi:tripartite-type tricarboxylate transporter receptor subunit TctC